MTKLKFTLYGVGLLAAALAIAAFAMMDWRSHRELDTIFRMRQLGYLITLHKKDHGNYPGSIAEMVAASKHEKAFLFQPPILDGWQNEIVYDPAGDAENGFRLYSFGENETDEKALGDDINYWTTLGNDGDYWTGRE